MGARRAIGGSPGTDGFLPRRLRPRRDSQRGPAANMMQRNKPASVARRAGLKGPGQVAMVKDERSLRTRQRPVRSGALRGAISEIFSTRRPIAAPRRSDGTHRQPDVASTACSHHEDDTHNDESCTSLRHARESPTDADRPLALAHRSRRQAATAPCSVVLDRDRRPLALCRRALRGVLASPPACPRRAAPGKAHETYAVQCHPGGGTPGGDRRRSETDRPRHRIRREGTTQEQHLQGRHHPRRTVARSLLRRLRHRPPRLPAVQGNLPRLLPRPRRRSRQARGSRTSSRKARS